MIPGARATILIQIKAIVRRRTTGRRAPGSLYWPDRAAWSIGMCLGIPMQVVAIDGYQARCAAKGVARDVSLFLLQHEPVTIGDFVMVHVGYAIQKMTAQEARSAWEIYDQMLAAEGADSDA
jgi:hydrogenase expression/formation protein HypC